MDLKDVSKTCKEMIQYLRGIHRWDRVPLSYVAQPTSDTTPIEEVDNTSNIYSTYDEEMVNRAQIIEPRHAANAK